jgi:hypothetical protein
MLSVKAEFVRVYLSVCLTNSGLRPGRLHRQSDQAPRSVPLHKRITLVYIARQHHSLNLNVLGILKMESYCRKSTQAEVKVLVAVGIMIQLAPGSYLVGKATFVVHI